MTTDKTGGPAFPIVEILDANWKIQHGTKGMTLRDYFIAHAPVDPWPMFNPIMPPCPPSRWMNEAKTVEYETLREAEHYNGDCVVDGNGDAIREWVDQQKLARNAQWPCYWADTMIAERAK